MAQWKENKYNTMDYSQEKNLYTYVRQFSPGLYVITLTSLHMHSTGEGGCLLQNPFFISYYKQQE